MQKAQVLKLHNHVSTVAQNGQTRGVSDTQDICSLHNHHLRHNILHTAPLQHHTNQFARGIFSSHAFIGISPCRHLVFFDLVLRYLSLKFLPPFQYNESDSQCGYSGLCGLSRVNRDTVVEKESYCWIFKMSSFIAACTTIEIPLALWVWRQKPHKPLSQNRGQ